MLICDVREGGGDGQSEAAGSNAAIEECVVETEAGEDDGDCANQQKAEGCDGFLGLAGCQSQLGRSTMEMSVMAFCEVKDLS